MSSPSSSVVSLDDIISLCKRRGFVYPSADIYGGINGIYDVGNLGVLLKENIRHAWVQSLETDQGEILRFEGALLSSQAVWYASGHLENFADPLVDCVVCKHRYRADDVDLSKPCPHCNNKQWTEVRAFNLMFKTQLGAMEGSSANAYLRPETAQSIFINFKNIISTNRVKIPFGVCQIGKAFRNEITPKQFLFRMREFEQMELEWFCTHETGNSFFEYWRTKRAQFYQDLGIDSSRIRLRAHEKDELSHYSCSTTDVEYLFPFGWKELEGIAHRGSYDLSQHTKHSGKELGFFDETTKQTIIPAVIECSVGTDRLMLMILCDAYHRDIVEGEERIVLRLHPRLAPIKAAFLPLTNKLIEPTHHVYTKLKKTGISVQFDSSGSIGKRYRRQDEIGTPFCFTYDFESEKDATLTVRHRDSTRQERIAIDQIEVFLKEQIRHPSIHPPSLAASADTRDERI